MVLINVTKLSLLSEFYFKETECQESLCDMTDAPHSLLYVLHLVISCRS